MIGPRNHLVLWQAVLSLLSRPPGTNLRQKYISESRVGSRGKMEDTGFAPFVILNFSSTFCFSNLFLRNKSMEEFEPKCVPSWFKLLQYVLTFPPFCTFPLSIHFDCIERVPVWIRVSFSCIFLCKKDNRFLVTCRAVDKIEKLSHRHKRCSLPPVFEPFPASLPGHAIPP